MLTTSPLARLWAAIPGRRRLQLLALLGLTLVASAIRILAIWLRTRLTFATGADLSVEVCRRTLYQPCAVHLARNSSEVIDAVSGKVNTVTFSALGPLLIIASNALMLGVILVALLLYKPVVALATFAGFGLIYLVIYRLSRAHLRANSQRVATESTRRIKSLQEGLGGIRDVLLGLSGSERSLQDTLALLEQPMPDTAGAAPGQRMPFEHTLECVVMGLLQPGEGQLQVDGRPVTVANARLWQRRIAHVPQSIYLSDASIAENIAFGLSPERIDTERVRQAAAQAQMAQTIQGWPQGYETFVGERGVRLSGGNASASGLHARCTSRPTFWSWTRPPAPWTTRRNGR